jgi:hypothetical protein
MNWKKAGGILVTLGVTATAIYVSYSFVFLAKKKDFQSFKENCKDSELIKNLDDKKEKIMLRKVHNLSKKQLIKFAELCNKKAFNDSEKEEFESLKKKWGYEI